VGTIVKAMSEPAAREVLAPSLSRSERVDALYLAHRRGVYGTALAYSGGNHALAEDITQDVFFTALERIDDMPEDRDLGPWLVRVTINRCINAFRRQRVRGSLLSRWFLRDTMREIQSPETEVVVSESLRRVWNALEGLSPTQRAAFCLRHFDGERQTEIAKVLGYSEGYVSKLLRKAEDHVRRAGGEFGG